MSCLTQFRCLCITKNVAVASLPNKDTPPPVQTNTPKPPIPISKATTSRPTKKNRRPPVIEIERALGAGRFRDTEPKNSEEVKEAAFDMFMMNFTGKFEGPVEKTLRETGEWMDNQNERMFRISGKKILLAVFIWILPIWIISVLVAAGAIKLPFDASFLDQLIM